MDFDKMTGSEFAGYTVGRLIGKSAAGVTYLAEKEGTPYALKIFPPKILDKTGESIDRFLQTLEKAKEIRHDNLVGILETGEEQGLKFAVLEYLDVPTLLQVLEESGPLSVDRTTGILAWTLAGLAASHEAGLVHGDLKPNNIFIGPDDVVKLNGIGVSKKDLVDAGASLFGYEAETVEYISPEQVAASDIDIRTDLYSLGIIAYEMLVGNPPFVHESLIALRMLHSIESPPDPREENPDVSPALAAFILKLLAKEPNQRYPDPTAAAKALSIAIDTGDVPLSEEPANAETPPGPEAETPPASEGGGPGEGAGFLAGLAFGEDAGREGAPEETATPAETEGDFSALVEDAFSGFDGLLAGGDAAEPEAPSETAPAEPEAPAGKKALTEEDKQAIEKALQGAEENLGTGDFDEALACLDKGREIAPDEPRIKRMRERVEDVRNDYNEKRAAFQRLREEGDTLELERLAREIVALKPGDEQAAAYLGTLAALQAEQAAEAEPEAEAPAEGGDGGRADALVLQIHRMVNQNQFEEALEKVREAEALDPGREDVGKLSSDVETRLSERNALREQAEEAYRGENWPEALEAYKRLVTLEADPSEAEEKLADIRKRHVDVDDLVRAAQEALEAKNLNQVERLLDRILDKAPENEAGLKLKKELEELRERIEDFRTRAREHLDNRQYQFALGLYKDILALDPRDGNATDKVKEIENLLEHRGGGWKFIAAAAVVLLIAAAVLGGLWWKNKSALDRAETLVGQKKYGEAQKVLDGLGDFLVDAERRDGLRARIARLQSAAARQTTPEPPGASRYKPVLERVRNLIEQGAWDEALEALAEARKQGAPEGDVDVLRNKARFGKTMERGAEAEKADDWRGALEAYREAASFNARLAGEAEDALFEQLIEAAKPLKDTDPKAFLRRLKELGEAFGREDEIQPLYESVAVDPRMEEARKAREAGNWPKAVDLLMEAATNPVVAEEAKAELESIRTEVEEGAIEKFREKAFRSAAEDFEGLAERFPDRNYDDWVEKARYSVLIAEGQALLEGGKAAEAIPVFEKAGETALDERWEEGLETAKITLWTEKAQAMEAKEAWAEAKGWYEKILALLPGDADVEAKIELLEKRILYASALEEMETAFQEKNFMDALYAANEAVNSGVDDGTAARAGRYLKPLLEMIEVPGGPFTMGSEAGRPREAPAHEVEVPAFYVTKNEITVAEYAAFLEASSGGQHVPAMWDAQKGKPDLPVTGVSLADAKAYAAWMYFEIPTEAQWEKAARGEEGRTFPWGEAFEKGRANTYTAGKRAPAPVTAFEGDQSPFGCLNMAGNVAEWTSSPYRPYPGADVELEEGKTVIRGGDFGFNKKYARCSARRGIDPGARKPFLGFRCVRRITIRSLLDLEER